MQNEHIALATHLWRWTGDKGGNWFFCTIAGDAAGALSATALMHRLELGRARGFGSLKVTAQIGATRWQTSVFPQADKSWLLPVKAAVRRAEAVSEGDEVELLLEF